MKALLIVVVLSISLMVVGCQREVKPEPKVVAVDTVYVQNDSAYLAQSYLNYCVKMDCNRTDMCCEAIDNMSDALHDHDCKVYKTFVKRITKKAKAKK